MPLFCLSLPVSCKLGCKPEMNTVVNVMSALIKSSVGRSILYDFLPTDDIEEKLSNIFI